MATRIAGFVYSLSSGLPASGVTVTPRASDGSSGTTGTTNAGGFVSIAGLPDKTWTGTVANAAQVFVPATMGEGMLVDDLHGQRNTIGAHDFSQLRGKATVGQISSEAATAAYVLTSDGLGNATWSAPTGGGGNSFATIDCPAGTDPVADSSTDTLTLAAGTGISITGDSTADSVTFALNAALDDLSNVTVPAPSTNGFLAYNGSAWVDYNLFSTFNTWTEDQLISNAKQLQFGDSGQYISGDSATDVLTLTAGAPAGTIALSPTVAATLTTAIPFRFGSANQFVKGTTASALLELSSTNTAGIIRYDAKASHEFRIDSSATTDMTLTADKLAFLHGTYHVGFGWSVDGQLDTIIDNSYVDSFVAAETSFALDGGYGSGIKLLYRGIGINETVEADVGYNYWHYDDLADQRNCDWLIGTGAAGDQYRFFLGSVGVVKIATSPWLTLNDTSLTTKFTIGEDANDDVVIATSGSDNPQIVLQPRGNATMTLQSSSTAAYSMTWSSAVNTIQLTATNSSACSFQIDKSASGAFSFFVGTGAPTNTKIYLGKAHASSILSFFGATGTAQAANTTDIKDGLIGFGLWATGTSATPLDLDGGTLTAGKLVSTEWEYTDNMTIDLASASNKTLTCENSSTGKMTLRVAPDTCAPSSDDNYAKVGGIIKADTSSSSSTATTSEQTVTSYTVKANSAITTGAEVRFRFRVIFAATARSKAVRVQWGSGSVSGDILNLSTGSATSIIEGFVRKVSGGFSGYAWGIPGATGFTTSNLAISFSSGDAGTGDITFAILAQVGTGAAAGDVIIDLLEVEWYPGASA